MTEPTLTLFSADLLSKWGFTDGDDPEWWLDWCDTHGIDYQAFDFPWAAVVRKHLIPALDQTVTVVDIETIHNPIRAETVDGIDVRDAWYDQTRAPALTPDHVDVPMAEVLQLALAQTGLTEPPHSRGVTL